MQHLRVRFFQVTLHGAGSKVAESFDGDVRKVLVLFATDFNGTSWGVLCGHGLIDSEHELVIPIRSPESSGCGKGEIKYALRQQHPQLEMIMGQFKRPQTFITKHRKTVRPLRSLHSSDDFLKINIWQKWLCSGKKIRTWNGISSDATRSDLPNSGPRKSYPTLNIFLLRNAAMLLRLWKQVTNRMSAIRKQESCAFMWCAATHCSATAANAIGFSAQAVPNESSDVHSMCLWSVDLSHIGLPNGMASAMAGDTAFEWWMLTQLREAVPNSKSCVAYTPPISTATLFRHSPSTKNHETRNTPLCQFDFDRLPMLWNLTTSCFWTPILLLQTSLNLKWSCFCCAIVISCYFPVWSTSGFKEWAETYSHGNFEMFMVLGFQNMLGHWQPPSKASPSQFLLRVMKILMLSQTSFV